MNTRQSPNNDGEMDVSDIIRFIWGGKWIIIAMTAVTSIITAIYLSFQQNTYKGVVEIFPISTHEIIKYEELNRSKLFELNELFIEPSRLNRLFVDDFMTYKAIEESMKKYVPQKN